MARINGTPRDEGLFGSDGADIILGFGGHDTLQGNGGADTIFGTGAVFGNGGNDLFSTVDRRDAGVLPVTVDLGPGNDNYVFNFHDDDSTTDVSGVTADSTFGPGRETSCTDSPSRWRLLALTRQKRRC